VTEIIARAPALELGLSPGHVQVVVCDAARGTPSYLDRRAAVVVAVSSAMRQPHLLFGQSRSDVSLPGHDDRVHLIFVLLLPAGAARLEQTFTAAIAGSIESDYLRERLMNTSNPGEVIEVMTDGLYVAPR
jgi:hypothetical protein